MKKRSIIVLTLLAGCFTNSFAQKGEKTLTVEVYDILVAADKRIDKADKPESEKTA